MMPLVTAVSVSPTCAVPVIADAPVAGLFGGSVGVNVVVPLTAMRIA